MHDPDTNTERPSTDSLEVDYELTEEDYIAFNTYHMAHSPTIQKTRRRSLLMPVLAYMVVGTMLSVIGSDASGLVIFGIGSVIWLLMAPKYWQWTIRQRMQKMLREGQNRGLGPCKLAISPAGLHVAGPQGESNLKWSAVEK